MNVTALTHFDAHVHLEFFDRPSETASKAAEIGLGLLSCTVTPASFKQALTTSLEAETLTAAGIHPWWVSDGRCTEQDLADLLALLPQTRYVGEIGLDFGAKHGPEDAYERQRAFFSAIAQKAAETSNALEPKVLSIHSVQAAGDALDILESTGCLESCRCVFHWFSGPSDELHRAVKAGCWFSVNEMMLRTRRGREYARQIPATRLLTETDLPPENGGWMGASDIVASLERTIEQLAELRGADGAQIRTLVVDNAASLLE